MDSWTNKVKGKRHQRGVEWCVLSSSFFPSLSPLIDSLLSEERSSFGGAKAIDLADRGWVREREGLHTWEWDMRFWERRVFMAGPGQGVPRLSPTLERILPGSEPNWAFMALALSFSRTGRRVFLLLCHIFFIFFEKIHTQPKVKYIRTKLSFALSFLPISLSSVHLLIETNLLPCLKWVGLVTSLAHAHP